MTSRPGDFLPPGLDLSAAQDIHEHLPLFKREMHRRVNRLVQSDCAHGVTFSS